MVLAINSPQSSGNRLLVYPNPTNGNINITVGHRLNEEILFRLFNVSGEEVTVHKQTITNNEQVSISLLPLPNGIYMYQIFIGTENQNGKLMIDK
ncbi:MAG: T9SS type A sorting domain-containing protein [Bacteroidales bacterium]|nr:T9SS type A sorting domain-containing protein [Bacteroidales bacterium]